MEYKIAIVGITGMAGLELLRILCHHPKVKVEYLLTRQQKEDIALSKIAPYLSHLDINVTAQKPEDVAGECDVMFLALPHGISQTIVPGIIDKTRVIDLSADFRLQDVALYEKFYAPHICPDLLPDFIYGLPEVYREKIKKAEHIANPGCFALLCQSMLYPLKGLIKYVDITAVTGSSGSGKTPTITTHHPYRHHNLRSYGFNKHRHQAEIYQSICIEPEQLVFVPTSGSFVRGIFGTSFVHLNTELSQSELDRKVGDCYNNEAFIRLPEETVELSHVIGSQFCDLTYQMMNDTVVLIQGAIDNLIKGAAGTAVQNFNLMLGLPEDMGLGHLEPLFP